MEAPINISKWSSYCLKLNQAPDNEFEQRLPQALKKLRMKIGSVYADWQSNPICKAQLNALAGRISSIPNATKEKEEIAEILNELTATQKDSSGEILEELFPDPKEELFFQNCKIKMEKVLENILIYGPHLIKPTEFRSSLIKMMRELLIRLNRPFLEDKYGRSLRLLARQLEKLSPGVLPSEIKSYDERKFKIYVGNQVINVSAGTFTRFSRECEVFKPYKGEFEYSHELGECHLSESINVEALKAILGRHVADNPVETANMKANMMDLINTATELGYRSLDNIVQPYHVNNYFNDVFDEDKELGEATIRDLAKLIELERQTQNPYIHDIILNYINQRLDRLGFSSLVGPAMLVNLARFNQPKILALSIVVRIDQLMEHEKSQRRPTPFILGQKPVIDLLKTWYKLVEQLNLPHADEHLSWLISQAILSEWDVTKIPMIMNDLKAAFPAFTAQGKKKSEKKSDVETIDEFELFETQTDSRHLILDFTKSKEYRLSYENMKHLAGWKISEIHFDQQTNDLIKLQQLLPGTEFKYKKPPEPSTLEKATTAFKGMFGF